jgi:anaerobic glycerol-3-phosphate dehydrogenase
VQRSDPPVVVIGAGMAGTAAAFAVARAGVPVVVVHDRAGASALYSGALDLEPWDAGVSPDSLERSHDAPRDETLALLIAALGIHRLTGVHPERSGLVATQAGVVRPALGADDALLELAPLAGRHVAVADADRDDWDAPLIAKTLAASAWSRRTQTRFSAVAVRLLRAGHERRIAPYDLAALHDEPARRAGLAEVLKAASAGFDAWLLGPWLGLEPETVRDLRAHCPLPLGESTSLMGGPAGARFERARDRMFLARRIELCQARVVRVSARGRRYGVELETPENSVESKRVHELEARAVVLATGGVGAGGVRFTWQPPSVIRGFELPFEAPVVLALDGEVLGGGGSLYGPSLETIGLGALERVGIACDAVGRPLAQNLAESALFVAGDAVSGRPRTMLEAALAGLRAGNVATRD